LMKNLFATIRMVIFCEKKE